MGRRAALCGLVAKGILNGRKGLVHSYNRERDRMVLTIDGMQPDVAVRSTSSPSPSHLGSPSALP